jgi:hypothetical protein
MAHQQRGQLRLAQSQADPVTGDAGLGDLELRLADAVPVADADLVIGQAVDGQVLTEHAIGQVVAPEVLPPVVIGLDLVDEHRPLLAAVALGVALAVAIDVKAAHHLRTGHRLLPDTRENGLAMPRHVLRHPDIDRQQHRHPGLGWRGSTRGRRSLADLHAALFRYPGRNSVGRSTHCRTVVRVIAPVRCPGMTPGVSHPYGCGIRLIADRATSVLPLGARSGEPRAPPRAFHGCDGRSGMRCSLRRFTS